MSLIILYLFLCSGWLSIVSSQTVIEYLPGFTGKLPLTLETGYVGVGESENVQFFYYFVESEGNPNGDPLVLWLTGGPGCSGFSGLAYEIGPLTFESADSGRSVPKLVYNPYSWTKVASIIFVDNPAGTGFSYGTTQAAYNTSDSLNSEHLYQFIRKWLLLHPKYLQNPLYIAGDSYAGIFVPLVVDKVYNGNDAGAEPLLNIKGYIMGNPATDIIADNNGIYPYAHRMGLLSDKLYQSAKENCKGDFVNPDNYLCQRDMERVEWCLERICRHNILETWCGSLQGSHRSLLSLNTVQGNPIEFPLSPVNKEECIDPYTQVATWANNKSVREALHIREGTIGEWERCNPDIRYTFKKLDTEFYKYDVNNVVPYHEKFTRRDCRAFIYSGDHDMIVPHSSTEGWIESLTLSVESDWRPWFFRGQTAGYTMRYVNGNYTLTYATVKGGGHIPPENMPLVSFSMARRWLIHANL